MRKKYASKLDAAEGRPALDRSALLPVDRWILARYHRLFGAPTFFLTGTDEHGQKVQQAAVAEGKTPQAYCDELAAVWKAFAAKLELTNDDFVRTTEARP